MLNRAPSPAGTASACRSASHPRCPERDRGVWAAAAPRGGRCAWPARPRPAGSRTRTRAPGDHGRDGPHGRAETSGEGPVRARPRGAGQLSSAAGWRNRRCLGARSPPRRSGADQDASQERACRARRGKGARLRRLAVSICPPGWLNQLSSELNGMVIRLACAGLFGKLARRCSDRSDCRGQDQGVASRRWLGRPSPDAGPRRLPRPALRKPVLCSNLGRARTRLPKTIGRGALCPDHACLREEQALPPTVSTRTRACRLGRHPPYSQPQAVNRRSIPSVSPRAPLNRRTSAVRHCLAGCALMRNRAVSHRGEEVTAS